MRLSGTLRFLAGGSYLDFALTHQQSISSVYSQFETTMDTIDKALKLRFPYEDESWLASSRIGFSLNHRSPIKGCCAALDSIAIKIGSLETIWRIRSMDTVCAGLCLMSYFNLSSNRIISTLQVLYQSLSALLPGEHLAHKQPRHSSIFALPWLFSISLDSRSISFETEPATLSLMSNSCILAHFNDKFFSADTFWIFSGMAIDFDSSLRP